MDPNPVPSSPLLSGQETISHASSICSRKDSGIKSNSRRSSIQQQVKIFIRKLKYSKNINFTSSNNVVIIIRYSYS